jgi:hypothetical protein
MARFEKFYNDTLAVLGAIDFDALSHEDQIDYLLQKNRATSDLLVEPRDSMRQRFHVAPLGLWLVFDSGRIAQVAYNPQSKQLEVRLEPGESYTSTARPHVEQRADVKEVGVIAPLANLTMERGASVVPLGKQSVSVRRGVAARAAATVVKPQQIPRACACCRGEI